MIKQKIFLSAMVWSIINLLIATGLAADCGTEFEEAKEKCYKDFSTMRPCVDKAQVKFDACRKGGSADETKKDLSAAGLSPNIMYGVTKNRALYEKPAIEFEPGDWVKGFTKKLNLDSIKKFKNQKINVIFEFYKGSTLLAKHVFPRKHDIAYPYFSFHILPDPYDTIAKSLRWDWSGKFAEALSKLPKGKHEITIKGYLQSGNENVPILLGQGLVYNNQKGNGKMNEYAKLIQKNATFDIQAENEAFSKKHGRAADNVEQIQTTVWNNCGREVVITFANKRDSNNKVRLRVREYLKITINDGESVYISWKGKSAFSGPTIGSFEKGKSVNLCR
jgi:hypothetical protein